MVGNDTPREAFAVGLAKLPRGLRVQSTHSQLEKRVLCTKETRQNLPSRARTGPV
jgi:hypothetical protein